MRLDRFRSRLWVWGIVGAVAIGIAMGTAPILSGSSSAPTYSREAAERAVDHAREVRSDAWAPESLIRAESALRAAQAEDRRQSVRFILRRDFNVARRGFQLARERAIAAATEAIQSRASAATLAETALHEAEAALAGAEDLAAAVRMANGERRHLQRARTNVSLARDARSSEDFREAERLAELAAGQARAATRGAVALAARFIDENEVRRWRRWIEETISESRRTGGPAIVVNKERRELTLYLGGRSVRTFNADLGQNSLYAKLQSGDDATPEGRYRVSARRGAGESRYYKSLHVSYPNDEDIRRLESARRAGIVSRRARPGGLIAIHGHGGRGENWTNGCVAVADRHMDELFSRAPTGTPVTIVGGEGRGGAFSEIARTRGLGAGTASR